MNRELDTAGLEAKFGSRAGWRNSNGANAIDIFRKG